MQGSTGISDPRGVLFAPHHPGFEHFDAAELTRRPGDRRIVAASPDELFGTAGERGPAAFRAPCRRDPELPGPGSPSRWEARADPRPGQRCDPFTDGDSSFGTLAEHENIPTSELTSLGFT